MRNALQIITVILWSGGMPETVQIYIDTHDIAKVVLNQRSILNLYRLILQKYAEGDQKRKSKQSLTVFRHSSMRGKPQI